jgi:sporulation protein YlmC with PRC-barrel domain
MQDPANELRRIPLLGSRVNRALPESLSRDEVIMEVLGPAGSRRKGGPMALIRLEWHEHPAPPQHEMRQKSVLDSRGSIVGTVANLYVDEDSRQLRFVDVLTSEFLGLERKHHLVPVEAVSDQDSGSITLGVDQEAVESAPRFPDPHVGPDEEYQRTIRQHYGSV